jgi:PPP family 3-phenylpropionic acid transporter
VVQDKTSAGSGLVAARLAAFYGATFAVVGVQTPFWPVWLEARGLSATEIGLVIAASFWPRVVTSLVIPHRVDRSGERRRPMALLAVVTLIGVALFALADRFWMFMALNLLTGATFAAILPLGEALALQEVQRRRISYGRVRLWGSITFIVAAIAAGRWLEQSGPGVVLALLLVTLGATALSCLALPEHRHAVPAGAAPRLRRLLRQPGLMPFVLAAGLIQASHVVYYGFATLHWRAAGHGEAVIGWLWAEGVIAEIVLFTWAGTVLRRLPPLQLLALAGGLTVLRWGATALSTDLAVLVPAQALHAASFGAVHLATVHYLRDSTPPELHAAAQGLYAAIGGALLAGLITPFGGWLYGRIGGASFWSMAAIALLGTLMAILLARTAKA